MPVEITMPQLSDTMTEGTVVKWHIKEGDAVKPGDMVADVETDKATMPMEAYDGGTLAVIIVREGEKVQVGKPIGVIATKSEKADEVKKRYAAGAASSQPATAAPVQPQPPPAKAAPAPQQAAAKPQPVAPPAAAKPKYDFDIIVIGGGPAGYAAAIRAGQLKKNVLCIERENLGGTCLNWGCIPTKALLDDGAFIRKLRLEGEAHGVKYKELSIDFSKLISRSRAVADKLSRGIEFFFKKYNVQRKTGVGQLVGAHKVRITGPGGAEFTADHVILAPGARPAPLPFIGFDGQKIIGSREAMTLKQQPKRMTIIGAGAIGCEFADFYNAVGTEVTLVEMLDRLLPIEDQEVSAQLTKVFTHRNIDVRTKTRAEKVEPTGNGVKITLSGDKPGVVEADVLLVAIGVIPNTESLATPEAKLELLRNRIKTTPDYKTNLENVWSVGDCIAINWPADGELAAARHPDLAHVAHHEAVHCVEQIVGVSEPSIDYLQIPACTYTHPQVASMGYTEAAARKKFGEIKVGKFPFSASGRALAMGEPDGFVKLIFDPRYGELLGVHMIGESVTDMLAELVMARNLEATEMEIIEAIHPHPTFSEAVMEAAGVADGRSIHW